MGLIPAFLRTDPPTHMFPHLFFIKKKKKPLASLAFPKFQRANLIREMEKMQKQRKAVKQDKIIV